MSIAYCLGKKCFELNDPQSMIENNSITDFASFLVHLFASIIAAYIAWNRTASMGLGMQVLMTVLAFLFGVLYLIYLVGVVMMGDSLFKKTYLVNMPDVEMDRIAKQISG